MTIITEKFRRFSLGVAQLRPAGSFLEKSRTLARKIRSFSAGINFKLSLLIISLVTLTAGGISMVVISIMDDVQLQSMIKRGSAISQAAASPAGYSILAGDQLALDNLASRISLTQPDLDYLVILDNSSHILAHNQLELTGTDFKHETGFPIGNNLGLTVKKVSRNSNWIYEFNTPIFFTGKKVGSIITGLNASSLEIAKQKARNSIFLIIALLFPLAVSGSFLLSRLFTYPVKQLTAGVARVQAGEEQVIVPITSNDELATLTISFNEMSKRISAQRRSLVNYSEELEQSYSDIVKILAAALDARDNYTYGHSSRVSELSIAVGRKLQLKTYELKDLEMACLLHDLGKIRIPDAILNKPGTLTNQEYQYIKDHPYHGSQILELADSLKKYIPAVLHHHEWHDGTGYPARIAGDEIPLYARIISIADAYDAMTSSRPYRKGLTRDAAIEELIRFKNRQFSPDLVDLFIESLDEYADCCDLPGRHGAAW